MNSESPAGPENSGSSHISQKPRPPALGAESGWRWFRSGLDLLKRQLFRLLLLGLLLQFIAGFSQVGILGLLFIITVPAFTAGMLQGLHLCASGSRPTVMVLFSAFSRSERLPALLLLGALSLGAAIFAVGIVLAGSVSGLDPDLLARIEAGDVSAVGEIDPTVLQTALLGLAAGLLLSGSLSYFSVPLIWFGGMSLSRALIVGVSEMFRQWKALLVLGLMLGLLGIPVGLVVGMILSAQLMAQDPSALLTVVMLVVVVVYQLMVFASQYVAFSEVFGLQGGKSDDRPPGQLVA